MVPDSILKDVEERLSLSRPFGNVDYLDDCTTEKYSSRLVILSEYLIEAKTFLDSFLRSKRSAQIDVLRDPVVRNSVNDALVYFRLDKEQFSSASVRDWAAILQRARSIITDSSTDGASAPLEAGLARQRLPGRPDGPLIWSGARQDDVPATKFDRLFNERFPQLRLVEPDASQINLLKAGASLLDELLPELGRSALRHVYIVAIAGAKHGPVPFTSMTHPNILGAVFFSPSVLKNEWFVAEHLLHEALHVKFLDIRHTHSLLRHAYTDEASRKTRPHWNRPQPGRPSGWSVDRSLTVLHVYVCLGLFFLRLQERHEELLLRFGERYATNNPQISARRAFDRARYLIEELRDCQELGAAGEAFLTWLADALDDLDLNPPSPRSVAHLLLDRYSRECSEIDYVLASATAKNDHEALSQVAAMLRQEMNAAQDIVQVTGSPGSAARFSDLAYRLDEFIYRDDRPSATPVRTEVHKAIITGATSSEQGERAKVDALVKEFVERSSEQLNLLLARFRRAELTAPLED